ncbi:hypothetical protein L1049_000327 [Liquidambar formosana]|uniref:Uncharacterized protein n=1 Tax=Liquidambar formosana TaxID=63359 RepID=A0AAP0R5A4_LIQFO
MEVTNKYITINTHIEGAPQESDFELKAAALSLSVEPGSNDVIVKNLYLSIDPYQINRMKSFSSSQKTSDFAVGIIPGQAIDAFGVGRVVASGNPKFEKDDLVAGVISWGEYSVVGGATMLNKLDPMGFPLSYHVGILGAFRLFKRIGVTSLNIQDYLAMGAILSSTNSVCTLQVLNQDKTPFLYSVVFGEGVVNDATSIVLFNAVQSLDFSNIGALTALELLWTFLYLFFTTIAFGIAVRCSLLVLSITAKWSVTLRHSSQT